MSHSQTGDIDPYKTINANNSVSPNNPRISKNNRAKPLLYTSTV